MDIEIETKNGAKVRIRIKREKKKNPLEKIWEFVCSLVRRSKAK